jgi:predicted O-linked N-acetylglucosamine transferase (SPINDLY family)
MPPPDARLAAAARLHQVRDHTAAEAAYRAFLAEQPNHADALLLFGTLLHETGRHDEAVRTFRLGLAPANRAVELRWAMVDPLVALGEVKQAVEHVQEVVRLAPKAPGPLLKLAELLGTTGDYISAEPYARRAVELLPESGLAWLLLARSHVAAVRLGEAMAAFDRAVALSPTSAEAACERAFLLQLHGRLAEAIAGYEHGLRLAPNDLNALNNAGVCYQLLAYPGEAVRFFAAAVALQPNEAKPRNNLGATLKDAGRIDEAIPHLELAAALDPAYAGPRGNIGSAYAVTGDHARAVAAFRAAEAIDPTYVAGGSNVLMSLLNMDDVEPATLRAEHVDWARRHADAVDRQPPVIADRSPGRRLRIGYLSPDFREHSVRFFIEPILAAHDRSAVEVHCYVAGLRRDGVTGRLSKLADAWHDVAALSDVRSADLIRSHGIDVLVDLAGHTSDNRLLTFARRAAPVQVAYLGYPATSGLRAIGYRLTDAVADPIGVEPFYTETLVRLPDAFFVYADDPAKQYDATLPADRNRHVTFGAFNSFSKVTPASLATWATILAAVPGSRLLLKAKPLDNPSTRAAVLAAFAAAGVSADRLDLRTWVPLDEHTALLGSVDLMLDTFPYAGHTTTCQGLWMGAPTVTRYGREFRGRVGLSIMTQLGLPEFAVDSADAYARRATELATDLSRLRALRPTWRDRMRASPLCDAARFTRGLEAAYRTMWATAISTPGRAGV